MKVGFSSADITPSYGMERPGSTDRVLHQGVHDRCLASACVVGDGDREIAVVGLDALSVKRSTVEAARRTIVDAVGIPGSHVMVAASHTHAGGPLAEHIFSSTPDAAYISLVSRQIASAVIDAHRRAEELRIGFGVGEARGATYLRRWWMRDGTVCSHPGTRNPKGMDRPHGELDSSVGVIGVANAEGSLRGCIVNFACHGTTGLGGADMASADWVHYLRQCLQSVFGPDFGVVFINGACGDVTQVDNTDPGPHWRGALIARRVGMTVAGEAIKLLVRMAFREHARVAGAHRLVALAPRTVTREMLAWADGHFDSDGVVEGRWFADKVWAREWRELATLNEAEPQILAEVQALALGDVVLVSNPAECFSALGLDIKRRSKFAHTFVAGLSNGCIGYVGTRDAYADDYIPREGVAMTGGYETMPARSSKCGSGAGEVLVDASVSLLDSLAAPMSGA